MTIQDKFDKILKTNKLGIKSIFGLEKYCGVGVGSVSKFLTKGESPTLGTIKTIQDAIGINPDWLESGKGDIYLEKRTDVENTSNLTPADEEHVYHDLVESKTEYRLVHKTILNEEYRIMLKSEIEERASLMRQALEAKNELIEQLKKEITDLRNRVVHGIPHPKEAEKKVRT